MLHKKNLNIQKIVIITLFFLFLFYPNLFGQQVENIASKAIEKIDAISSLLRGNLARSILGMVITFFFLMGLSGKINKATGITIVVSALCLLMSAEFVNYLLDN